MDTNTCIDCGRKKLQVATTHSMQCTKCQDKFFDRLREVAGKYSEEERNERIKSDVKHLMDKGLKAYLIGEELDMTTTEVNKIIKEIRGAVI